MNQFRNFDTRPGTPEAVRFIWEREVLDDDSGDTSYLDADSGRYDDVEDPEERARYEAEDATRLADYGDGWAFVGVRAKLTLMVPIGGGSFTVYELASAGLWGVESDSGEDYLNEVYEDEKAELWRALRVSGLAVLAFDALGMPQA